jgi:hypothetical protein
MSEQAKKVSVSKEAVIQKLLELPQEIYEAEQDLINCQRLLDKARKDLQDRERLLLTSNKDDGTPFIDGKNEVVRTAQLKQLTMVERDELAMYENGIPDWRAQLAFKQAEFAAYRSIARLMAGGAE